MRNINDFLGLEEISILCQYLYLKEENTVTFDNGVTYLQLRMDEAYNFYVLNLDFPNTPEIAYSDMMTVSHMLGIVDRLKETPPEDKDLQKASRWDEIRTIVKLNAAVNKRKRKIQKKGEE